MFITIVIIKIFENLDNIYKNIYIIIVNENRIIFYCYCY